MHSGQAVHFLYHPMLFKYENPKYNTSECIMNQVVRNIYLSIIALFMVSAFFLNVNYVKAESLIKIEIGKSLTYASELLSENIDDWIYVRVLALNGVKEAIVLEAIDQPDDIKWLLEETALNYPEMSSIYMGLPDNTLFISNDWKPEAGFDLRSRPWYLKALESDDYIVTEPFEDAYTKAQIISIATPVYSRQGDFMGVLSCDIPLDTIQAYIETYASDIQGMSLLVNENFEVVAQYGQIHKVITTEKVIEYGETQFGTGEGALETDILGVEGFYQVHLLKGTSLKLISFVPFNLHDIGQLQMRNSMYALMLTLAVIYVLFYFFQKQNITEPLMNLERDIEAIDVSTFSKNFQLKLESNTMFEKVKIQINSLLKAIFASIREIELQKHQFEALFKNSPNAMVMFDKDHQVVNINDSFKKLFGYDFEEIEGSNLDDVVASREDREVTSKTEAVFSGDTVDFEAIRYNKNRQELYVKVTGVPIVYEGETIGGYGIYQDISARVSRERYLEYVSSHDFLTNVYNRRHFEKFMGECNTVDALPLSLIMVDVNGLKIINDAFGNEEGDRMLVITGELLKELADEVGANVFRIGGDEFAILMKNSDGHATEKFAKKIKRAHQVRHLGDLRLSLAIGWAERVTLETPMAALLKDAEDFMFSHKLNENPSVRNQTVMTVMNTLHEKSKREEQHSKRVSALSYALGKALKLRDRECEMLRLMGLLHDVGKIAIDDKILNKTSRLGEEEYAAMKRHPEIGFRILSAVNELSEIANHVLAHHERWDGKGYPKGLKAEEIPYLARVISLTDAYDAMTSTRSYRVGLSVEEALEEIERHSGTQFDPELVDVFIQHIREIE